MIKIISINKAIVQLDYLKKIKLSKMITRLIQNQLIKHKLNKNYKIYNKIP